MTRTSRAGAKAPSTAAARTVAAVAVVVPVRRPASATPAATRGRRTAATMPPTRAEPTAVASTGVVHHARAARARGSREWVTTRAPRYAVSAASGSARVTSTVTTAP